MIDLEWLKKQYFIFDEPVKYQLKCKKEIEIIPISLKDSEIFNSCADILTIDKNSLPDARYISMSYLQFIYESFFASTDENIKTLSMYKLGLILCLSLKWENPQIGIGKDGKIALWDMGKDDIITSKDFEDLRRIIMYQNLPHYDDSYINPDIKKAMEEYDSVTRKNLNPPDLERKMAIITAHSGISKQDQKNMTYRSHQILFEEVCGEVDFITVRPVALLGNMFSKDKSNFDHWIFPKKKNKFDKYFTSDTEYNKSMGGNGAIHASSSTSLGSLLEAQFNSINN